MSLPAHTTVPRDLRISIDLKRTAAKAPPSYIGGRTFLRDELMRANACSAVDAERIVDRLERTGIIHFEPERAPSLPDRGRWFVREEEIRWPND